MFIDSIEVTLPGCISTRSSGCDDLWAALRSRFSWASLAHIVGTHIVVQPGYRVLVHGMNIACWMEIWSELPEAVAVVYRTSLRCP